MSQSDFNTTQAIFRVILKTLSIKDAFTVLVSFDEQFPQGQEESEISATVIEILPYHWESLSYGIKWHSSFKIITKTVIEVTSNETLIFRH